MHNPNFKQLPPDVRCGFCSISLDPYTIPQREEHYEQHFREGSEGSSNPVEPLSFGNSLLSNAYFSPAVNSRGTGGAFTNKWKLKAKGLLKRPETDIFWLPAQTTKPPRCYTPGLIPIIRKAFWKSHSRGNVRCAALCYERTVHISREMWDVKWGCGYRNFLMACTALMDQPFQPLYFPLLDSSISPGVRNLQRWIEEAWAAGFDEEGAKELKHLVGTDKWVGTSDLWVAFSFRGIPAELVDFNLENQRHGTDVLMNWIVGYFSPETTSSKSTTLYEALTNASPIVTTDRMPLILQHNGHSRTIVGYERDKNGVITLLTFDPSYVIPQDLRDAALKNLPTSSTSSVLNDLRSNSPTLSGSSAEDIEVFDTKKLLTKLPSTSSNNQKRRVSDIMDGMNSGTALKRTKISARQKKVPNDVKDDMEVIVVSDSCDNPDRPSHMRGGAEKSKADDDDVVFVGYRGKQKVSSPKYRGGANGELKKHDGEVNIDPTLLKRFRLNATKLGKKNQYQILYFPMTSPLTEAERGRRKVVRSTKIC